MELLLLPLVLLGKGALLLGRAVGVEGPARGQRSLQVLLGVVEAEGLLLLGDGVLLLGGLVALGRALLAETGLLILDAELSQLEAGHLGLVGVLLLHLGSEEPHLRLVAGELQPGRGGLGSDRRLLGGLQSDTRVVGAQLAEHLRVVVLLAGGDGAHGRAHSSRSRKRGL